MKKTTLTRHESRFLLLAVGAATVCVMAAFWFAVPLRAERTPAIQPVPMTRLARVDLNTAGLDALMTLPGVGEQRAQAILDYRRENGVFRQVEDAADVPGLTEEIVASWNDLAYVS